MQLNLIKSYFLIGAGWKTQYDVFSNAADFWNIQAEYAPVILLAQQYARRTSMIILFSSCVHKYNIIMEVLDVERVTLRIHTIRTVYYKTVDAYSSTNVNSALNVYGHYIFGQ